MEDLVSPLTGEVEDGRGRRSSSQLGDVVGKMTATAPALPPFRSGASMACLLSGALASTLAEEAGEAAAAGIDGQARETPNHRCPVP